MRLHETDDCSAGARKCERPSFGAQSLADDGA
jgi:hypothetical protein